MFSHFVQLRTIGFALDLNAPQCCDCRVQLLGIFKLLEIYIVGKKSVKLYFS
ncbi:MAG: hypothetical protein LBK06_01950 [Planctomycetaceae bacterium]|nr:hypothetical protein [Planctomycetaceae bacterium]